jgi:hypothetical protein
MSATWPDIPYTAWSSTCTTLELWVQVVGKVRLALSPWVNHSWQATLYVTSRGFSTDVIPHETCSFELEFDFLEHVLRIRTTTGVERRIPLARGTIAGFHANLLGALDELGLSVKIHGFPNEKPSRVPFAEDNAPRDYDAEAAQRFWRALVQVDRVFERFRTGFLGKVSPVHLFWGSFDLAVTRFSGRRAPLHPGGIPNLPDVVTREAYSHEVSSAGFWAGGNGIDHASFYSYAYPTPSGFLTAKVLPAEAYFHEPLGEFLLPYDVVRTAQKPDDVLLSFLQSTYEAAANLAEWDRAELECSYGRPGIPRALGNP